MTLSNSKKKESIGFGFVPKESQVHFLVIIPKGNKKEVLVYERQQWQGKEPEVIDHRFDELKVKLSKAKWEECKSTFAYEFNPRLRSNKLKAGKWSAGNVSVHRLLGKEMLVLLWAIADCDPKVIDTARRNWLGLRPEERWWLYTMTNASTGGVDDNNRGWRKALRYALTENPVPDPAMQPTLLSVLSDRL